MHYAMLFSACLLLASEPAVHEIALQSGDICSVVPLDIDGITALLLTKCRASSGELLWSVESPMVRSDAAYGLVCEGASGNVLSVCSYGEGYTDILIQLIDPAGNVIRRDTIAMQCYDSPQALRFTGEGFVLLWDSWSEQRGVHMALIDNNGSVAKTEFVSYTVNPGPVALSAGNVIRVGLSPILAQSDVLFCYSPEGELLWSLAPPLPASAELIQEISLKVTGEFSVVWRSLPRSDGETGIVVTEHYSNGEINSEPSNN